jgi:hypothetical protein
MVSQIISSTIDESYPVAGQDNDSQGFRDNFSIIKTALDTAKSEITDLLDNVARKDEDNNFDGNNITGANLLNNTFDANLTYATGITEDSESVSWAGGYVHVFRCNVPALTLTITDMPAENYMQMRLILTAESSTDVTIDSQFGSAVIKTDDSGEWSGNTITVDSTNNPKVVEVFTYNAGATLFLRYLGQFS